MTHDEAVCAPFCVRGGRTSGLHLVDDAICSWVKRGQLQKHHATQDSGQPANIELASLRPSASRPSVRDIFLDLNQQLVNPSDGHLQGAARQLLLLRHGGRQARDVGGQRVHPLLQIVHHLEQLLPSRILALPPRIFVLASLSCAAENILEQSDHHAQLGRLRSRRCSLL
ncbi:hypothetical protein DM02DRAFT_411775 [Periconia macrospinosa]|uniref:Uncharacterized protein n=1 Tax=Periconia macrospinosa TaxID=97972 RepID=A0A2V1DPZ4_9PLEO|nr:hypothetical protein DM02DRAFT_411775 [Periconia macrospinosa]